MKKYLFLFIFLYIAIGAKAQTGKPDSVVYLLHKFEQKIGREVCYTSKTANAIVYTVNFKFVDRSSPVVLKATLKLTPAFEPLALHVKGQTSRFSSVNDSITIEKGEAQMKVDDSVFVKKLSSLSFPVSGYSPGTVQQMLLQYWQKHGEPASIDLLPFGSVQIKRAGVDAIPFKGKNILLNRFIVGGLIWGNELIWTDQNGKLICLLTNDAEGDKLEMMSEPYEELLPIFTQKAAVYGMQLFANATRASVGQTPPVIAFVGGALVDVVNKISSPNMIVIIEKGIIKKIGKAGLVKIPAGAKIIDAKGKTILPGLWDMHAHFEQVEWGPAYLAAGVTTIRDCGNERDFINPVKQAIDSDNGIGPEILKAGIIDGKGPMALGVVQADTKEEAIAAVQRYKAEGFAQIKLYSSVKPAMVKVICDEAHRLGLTVTGHIPQGMTLQQGVDSGMNMVNHVQYVYSILKKNKDRSADLSDSMSVAAFKFIRDHKVVIDPTIGVYEMSMRSVKDPITNLEPNYYNLPQPLQVLFKTVGEDAETAKKLKPLLESLKQIVRQLHEDSVQIVAGTDMGFPGYSLYRELELYVDAGLTPAEALQTATIIPARVMKMDKRKGSVDEGKQADIILVEGNPLTNIRNIRNVQLVIKKGKVYNPAVVHRLVGFKQ